LTVEIILFTEVIRKKKRDLEKSKIETTAATNKQSESTEINTQRD
jgi:hypothetical protein